MLESLTQPASAAIWLPSYEAELEVHQRHAVRTACLLAAPLLLVFALLDRVLAPGLWLWLLPVRLTAACGLLFIARRVERDLPSVLPLIATAVALIATTIETAVVATGGVHSQYLTSFITVLAGVAILVPLRVREAVLVQALTCLIALLPLGLTARPGDLVPLLTSGSYFVLLAILCVAGAHVHDGLRRREHRGRSEMARQMGLVNLGTLAGGLAHELTSPLTYVSLEVELLEQDPRLDDSLRDKVHATREGLLRMRDILLAMRQGARFSSERRVVLLEHEVELALTLVGQRMRGKVRLEREYAGGVPLVSCQPTLLGQVFVNLVLNALDALAERADPRLTARVRVEAMHAVVEIEDNGPGVPDEVRERIFDPFFSTKGERGNGLGLWISAEIARMHGGSLKVSRGERGGARFSLALPLEEALRLEASSPMAAARLGSYGSSRA